VDTVHVPVDDVPPTVDDAPVTTVIGPWTDGGRTVEETTGRGKHTGVVRRPGENPLRRPQEVHPTEPRADLGRSRVVHSFHTPYYGDGIYLRTPSLQYGVWVTTREERQ
jgi:hypothetical protein